VTTGVPASCSSIGPARPVTAKIGEHVSMWYYLADDRDKGGCANPNSNSMESCPFKVKRMTPT